MKILVLGAGGREHAIVWKLKKDGHEVVCGPGNAGISQIADCVELNLENIASVVDYARHNSFDLTVVGPEGPLVMGIADAFRSSHLPVFGPNKEAAQLEGSKAFAKHLIRQCRIPTPRFTVFTDVVVAKFYLDAQKYPMVIKASGLALGKGAIVVHTRKEANAVIDQLMVNRTLGEAGSTVVIEEFLTGEEISVIGITDGEHITYLPPSQDHKALLDGDQGPNTGGMGAYAPAPIVTPELQSTIEEQIFTPLLKGLRRRGIEYRGVIYAGIMVTSKGPFVLEFNCRFGDPETQALLPLLDADLGELLLAAAQGKLKSAPPRQPTVPGYALCVVAASDGYPGKYEKGKPISGVGGQGSGVGDTMIFHAGTKFMGSQIVTSGGRVLGVTGLGKTLSDAKRKAYAGLSRVKFEGMQYRRDIGDKGIARLKHDA